MDTATSSHSQDAEVSALAASLSGMPTSQQPHQDLGCLDDLPLQQPADMSEWARHNAFRHSIPISHQFTEGDTVARACHKMDWEAQQIGFANANIIHREYRHRDIPVFRHNKRKKAACDLEAFRPVAVTLDQREFTGYSPDGEEHWLSMRLSLTSQVPAFHFKIKHNDDKCTYIKLFAECIHMPDGTSGIKMPVVAHSGGNKAIMTAMYDTTAIKDSPPWSKAAKARALQYYSFNLKQKDDMFKTIGKGKDRQQLPEDYRPLIGGRYTQEEVYGLVKTAEEGLDNLSEQDQFIALLYGVYGSRMQLFAPFVHLQANRDKTAEIFERERWNEYFTQIMHLACKKGNFWWYTMQSGGQIGASRYSFERTRAPRWMAISWWPHEDGVALREAEWAAFKDLRVLRTPAEHRFVLRLGANRIRQNEKESVEILIEKTQEGWPFQARIIQNTSMPMHYLICVYTGLQVENHKIDMLPKIGQEVTIKTKNSRQVFKNGEVIGSLIDPKADFVVSVTGHPDAGSTEPGQQVEIALNYETNELGYNRTIKALAILGHDPTEWDGVNMQQVLLGCTPPPQAQPGEYGRKLKANSTYDKIVQELREPRFNLNDSQIKSIVSMFNSHNGTAIIQGPPGTGKSQTLNALHTVLAENGLNVLVCGTTITAVGELVKKRQATMGLTRAGLQDSFCVVSNVFSKRKPEIKRKDKPKDKDLAEEKANIQCFLAKEELKFAALWLMLKEQESISSQDALARHGFALKRWQYIHSRKLMAEPGSKTYTDADWYLGNAGSYDRLSLDDKERMQDLEAGYASQYLSTCKTVFCTVNLAADPGLSSFFKPQVIIIDEAGSATIADTAVPLLVNQDTVKFVVLAGDNRQQLPLVTSMKHNEVKGATSHSLLSRLSQADPYRPAGSQCPSTQLNV